MRLRLASLGCALLAGSVVASLAAPASAGLDFTDTATLAGATNAIVSINGGAFGGIGTTGTIADGFAPTPPPTTNRVKVTAGAIPIPFSLATLQWSYTGLNGGVVAAEYVTEHGDLPYNMVIQFGDIVIGAGGALVLSEISFSETLGPASFGNIYSISRVLTAADSNTKLFIRVPSIDTGLGAIPPEQRDLVRVVQLQFIFGGVGTSFVVNAVVNPEPGTLALFALGAAGLGGAVVARRKKRAAKTA